VPAEDGVELPDLEAARARAAANARFTLAQTAMDKGKCNFTHRIDIEDEQGPVLDTTWFRDDVQVEG
jgi:hypothetical protein